MRKLMALTAAVALALTTASAVAGGKVGSDCTFKGKKLYGKVKFVKNFPDIKIEVVDHFPDLKVKKVKHFPDKCGKWQVVDNFPDIKVQIVKHFGDIKVKFVDHFPGVP
jgi:acylphosphatase